MANDRDPQSLQLLTREHLIAAARAWHPDIQVSDLRTRADRQVTIEGSQYPTKVIIALAHELAGQGTLTAAMLAGTAARRRLTALDFPVSPPKPRGIAAPSGLGDGERVVPAQLLRTDVLAALRELDADGDARRIGEDLHETAWRIPANGRWYSMLTVLQISLRRHGIDSRAELKALLRPRGGMNLGHWRDRLAALGFPPARGLGDARNAPAGPADGPWPPPDELTAARIIAAAQAWGDQTDAFRTAHAARDWEVWIAGAAYPVKAICRLAYLALGYDPQSIQAWKKGDRYSPWDKQIEALGFEIHAKADPEEFELERFLEREDMPTEIRREGIVRLTQGRFRRDLIAARRGAERCDVTGIAIPEILRASHIHRWTDCKDTPMMRKDPANGLLLAAHLDALFEHGLIAFANDGRMLVSGRLDTVERKRLHIDEPWQLRFTPSPQQCKYLAIHRKRTRAARGEDQE